MANEDGKIVSFEAAQDRRTLADMEADQAQWDDLRERLLAVMMATDMNNRALETATINALIEALERSGMAFDDAKSSIMWTVKMQFK